MSIQPLGFLDTRQLTALYVLKHEKAAENGVLRLRDFKDDETDPTDLPILREWKSARAVLARVRSAAAPFFEGRPPTLGRAWIETVPPMAGTPWAAEQDDYAEAHHRTRTCLIPCPGAMSYSGQASANLLVGIVNLIDHRQLCSEVNMGEHSRVHLIVDVKAPVDDAET
jgi:hypothetical protein